MGYRIVRSVRSNVPSEQKRDFFHAVAEDGRTDQENIFLALPRAAPHHAGARRPDDREQPAHRWHAANAGR